MANWSSAWPQSLIGIIHFLPAFRIARYSILNIASREVSTLNQRRGQNGQYYKPETGQVNQTYAPFSRVRNPDKQGIINWEVLEKIIGRKTHEV